MRASVEIGEMRSVPSTPSSSSTPPPAFDEVLRSSPSDKPRTDHRSSGLTGRRERQRQPANGATSQDAVNRLNTQAEAIR